MSQSCGLLGFSHFADSVHDWVTQQVFHFIQQYIVNLELEKNTTFYGLFLDIKHFQIPLILHE